MIAQKTLRDKRRMEVGGAFLDLLLANAGLAEAQACDRPDLRHDFLEDQGLS